MASCLGLALGLTFAASSPAATPAAPPPPPSPWAEWIEPDFPFFSSVLDLRESGSAAPAGNLVARGLILNLGQGLWAGFDTELLRVAAIWEGNGVTPAAIGPLSYHVPSRKTGEGKNVKYPQPVGNLWLTTGAYPGWQRGAHPTLTDPREPAPIGDGSGGGPLPRDVGHFQAVRLTPDGARLEYTVFGVAVREHLQTHVVGPQRVVERHFHLAASDRPLVLVLAHRPAATHPPLHVQLAAASAASSVQLAEETSTWVLRIEPHPSPRSIRVFFSSTPLPVNVTSTLPASSLDKEDFPARRWPQTVTTQGAVKEASAAYVVDDIAIPTANPWRRNVRLADIQFLSNGRGIAVTMDGDVWRVDGLEGDLQRIRWQRFASGLHEPMSLAIRDDEIFVFDRNGIWRLRDTDDNGEADEYQLFSNVASQTAGFREFPNTIKLAPDGSFVLAKGGQSSLGKESGAILRISPDGLRATRLGWGFRQPFAGVNPRTGLVTASDQQGQYVPATPLFIVEGDQYYGFLPPSAAPEKYPAPIADPWLWIPHPVNPSAVSQVWLMGARMGPLNDALIHIGYNRPEVFLVLPQARSAKPQATIISLTRDFDFPPLNGAVNPRDGQLYITGYQIWGTSATRISGLGRVRYTERPSTLPREVIPMDQGVLVRFGAKLDPATAANPANYTLARWNYQRTHKYGSPHYKRDGSTGQESLVASSAYLSLDGKSVFIGIPDMTSEVMQMQVSWSLALAGGPAFSHDAYFTPYELATFSPRQEGFGDIRVDLTPRAQTAADGGVISLQEGQRIAEAVGCLACHSIDASPRVGPTWKGLYGTERVMTNGERMIADEAYLRESILSPSTKIVRGFEEGMPAYAGILTDAQLASLLLYIKSL